MFISLARGTLSFPALVLTLFCIVVAWRPLSAADLAPPSGRVLLRISGEIEHRNAGNEAALDRQQLEALPQVTVRTVTPWTDGIIEFQGPLARDVLALAGAHGTTLQARAVNDYQVAIPVSDLMSYDVVLAMRRDGKLMSLRDRGPLWVIYPWSEHKELRNEQYHGRAIWQLEELVIE